jgi:multidrug resistance efflux pump
MLPRFAIGSVAFPLALAVAASTSWAQSPAAAARKPADTAAAKAGAAAEPKAPKTAAAERGDLALVVERSGRVEPSRKTALRFEPEAFSGAVTVKEIVRRAGPVKAGEVVATLEGKDFDKGLEDLRTQVAEARQRLGMQREERAMQARTSAAGVERAELAAAMAEQALQLFQDYEAAKALEVADLGLKAQMDGLKDSKDELSQLEKMYSGTSLQTETKDIVLDRARRGAERGEAMSKFAKRDNEIFKAIKQPNEARRVADSAKYSKLELESSRLSQRLGELRAALELSASERSLRDLERRLERMEGDAKRMTVKAEGDGYLVVQVRDAGDAVQAKQALAEVVDLGTLRVRGSVNADAMRLLKPGDVVQAWFPARPEARAEAVIDELVGVGSPDGDGASFPFTATLRNVDGAVLPGIEAKLVVRGTLAGRTLVPSKAVKSDKGRFTVRVMADGKETEREVRTGASDGTRTEVVSGLQPGELVVVPDA